jgi:hypothetical protein
MYEGDLIDLRKENQSGGRRDLTKPILILSEALDRSIVEKVSPSQSSNDPERAKF